MEVICNNCKTTYMINESKVPEKDVEVECKNCESKLRIGKKISQNEQKDHGGHIVGVNAAEINCSSCGKKYDACSPGCPFCNVVNKNYSTMPKTREIASVNSNAVSLETKYFKTALSLMFWVKSKEKPKIIKNVDKPLKSIFKKLSHHKDLVHLADKETLYEELTEVIKTEFIVDGKIYDSHALDYFRKILREVPKSKFSSLFGIIMPLIVENKVISAQEKESLYIFGKAFDLSGDYIDKLIEKHRTGSKPSDHLVKQDHIKSKKVRFIASITSILGLIIIAFTGYGFYQYTAASRAFEDFSLHQFIQENPKLVFKKVFFSKYVIYGKPPGTLDKFEKLYIYHASGYADFQFDMNNLDINNEKTDFITKELVLSFKKEVPIEVDVNIPQDKFNKIEELKAKPITEAEAKLAGKIVAVPAAIAGAYAGSKLGAGIGGTIFKVPLVGRIVGGAAGGAIGAGGAGAAAYVMTKNFLNGVQLESNSLGEQDQIPNIAKSLIALELMGGKLLTRDSWDSDIKQYYQSELENMLKELFREYGWESIQIEYIK